MINEIQEIFSHFRFSGPTTGKWQKKASQVMFLFSPFFNLLLNLPCFHYRMPRQRVDPMTPKLSKLTTLLKNVPIGWFEPAYWNLEMTVHEKAHYDADGVHVTLPIEQLCEKMGGHLSNGRVYFRATSWSSSVILS